MRLYNAIAIYDVYVIAESGESAREALLATIQNDADFKPSEVVATESMREGAVRESWQGEKPVVAADVSDEDFTSIKGKTTIEIFQHLYLKR